MPYATLPNIWWHGSVYGGASRQNVASALNLNQTTRQRICQVFRAPKAGTIHRVLFGVATTVAMVDVRVSLQDLTSGNPDGTEDQYRDHVAGDFTAGSLFRSGLLTNDGTDLGTPRTVAHGDSLALVLRWSGTPGGTSQLNWTGTDGSAPVSTMNQAYRASYNGTSWSKTLAMARVAIEYSDGSVEPVSGWYFPSAGISTPNLGSSSTPDEVGVRFQLAFTAKLTQAMLWVGTAGGLFDVVLYDASDTVLATFSGANNGSAVIEIPDSSSPFISHYDDLVLDKDAVYRLTIKATTTGVETPGYYSVTALALSAFPGLSRYYWTERTDGGAWTDRSDRMPMFLLGFSQLLVQEVAP